MERKNHRGQITITLRKNHRALVFFIPLPKAAVHSEKSGGQEQICVLHYQTTRQTCQQNIKANRKLQYN